MTSARGLRLSALLCLVAALAWSSHAKASSADLNVAEGRAYSLSPPPNYPGAEDPTHGLLTDGRHAFLLAPALSNAVAWRRTAPVSISLDLGGLRSVGALVLQSFSRPTAALYHPSQVFAYASADGTHFQFLGQSALSPNGASGATELSFAAVAARHVLVVVYLRGDFLALDEVELRGGLQGAAVKATLPHADIIADAAQRRQAAALTAGDVTPFGVAPDQRFAVKEPGDTGNSGGCLVRRVDPWSGFKAGTLASLLESDAPIVTSGTVGEAYAAWTVANSSATPQRLSVSGYAAISAISFVQAADLSWVGDVPQPATQLMLPPHATVMLLGRLAPRGGQRSAHVAIDCGDSHLQQDIAVTVIDGVRPALHANLWPYLKGAAAKANCSTGLLPLTRTDTAVIPPSALLAPGNELKHYFEAFRSAPRIYLFLDLKRPEWARRDFADWWRSIQRAAAQAGVTGEIVLYPFDEIRPEQVPALHVFRTMFSRISPHTKLFGTIDSKVSAEALGDLDIVQLLNRPELLRLARGARETHLYDTAGGAKRLPPYGYYRLQPWKAYAEGFDGVGLWSLWESDGADRPDTGWSLFGGGERDYGMIYAGRDGCPMPSLRLLAWRRGLEDAAILKRCETKIGVERMKLLAQSVADDPEDVAKADRALSRIAELCGDPSGESK